MIHIVLYQPKIPPNTGNVIRFCANTGLILHLIHPLGFHWDDKQLKRAGMDYTEFAEVIHYMNWQEFMDKNKSHRCFIITTKGKHSAYQHKFEVEDRLIFGSEDGGVATEHMQDIDNKNWLRIPMKKGSRSMNLSNTVAMLGYEALRQIGLPNLS